jgi:hypothetical protein
VRALESHAPRVSGLFKFKLDHATATASSYGAWIEADGLKQRLSGFWRMVCRWLFVYSRVDRSVSFNDRGTLSELILQYIQSRGRPEAAFGPLCARVAALILRERSVSATSNPESILAGA